MNRIFLSNYTKNRASTFLGIVFGLVLLGTGCTDTPAIVPAPPATPIKALKAQIILFESILEKSTQILEACIKPGGYSEPCNSYKDIGALVASLPPVFPELVEARYKLDDLNYEIDKLGAAAIAGKKVDLSFYNERAIKNLIGTARINILEVKKVNPKIVENKNELDESFIKDIPQSSYDLMSSSCGSYSCFNNQFIFCKSATLIMRTPVGDTSYEILGRDESGNCKVKMKGVIWPNGGLYSLDDEMVCLLTSKNFDDAVDEESKITGDKNQTKCVGPLAELYREAAY